MNVVHLTASTFLGGPERQLLGLASALADTHPTTLLSFSEGGRCRALVTAARRQGIEAASLRHDTPHFRAAIRELADQLVRLEASVLCCHGYKADLLGRSAARRAGVPVVAVSRGWTGENLRVRLYETLDRLHLRWMDRVVCVSEAQAERVRGCGAAADRVQVIPNAVDPERFGDADPATRSKLLRLFRQPPKRLIGAAGRLSPEKGFDVLVDAAASLPADGSVGIVVFGDGPCRAELLRRVAAARLTGVVAFAGHRADLDRFLPVLDLFVLPSHTEGMPNVVLEAFAAGVPVIATAVGGTPELIEDGATGFLVPPADPEALAARIATALASDDLLRDCRLNARQRVLERHTFSAQAASYRTLFDELRLAESASEAVDEKPQAEEALIADTPVADAEADLPVATAPSECVA